MKQTITIIDKFNNPYYKNNPELFEKLIQLVNDTVYFQRKLKSPQNKELYTWIINVTPKLATPYYSLLTKIYWIANGLLDFPRCNFCGKLITRNISKLNRPKYKYCSHKCSHNSTETSLLAKKTKLKKYGNETYNNREKFRKTLASMSDEQKCEYKEKIAKTTYEKYGVKHIMQSPEIIEKCRHTRFAKNNGKWESDATREKRKQTFIKHYGVDHNMKSKKGMQEFINSIQKHYNDNSITSAFQIDEVKQKAKATFKKHMQSEEFRKKRAKRQQQTSKLRYGTDNYMNRNKAKRTFLKKYGVENMFQIKEIRQKGSLPESREKANNTKRRNRTFNTSKSEEATYELLCLVFGQENVIRQYHSDKYPFNCDFYIKSRDLYIECNYSWTHGSHFFDKNNPEDQQKLQKWKTKIHLFMKRLFQYGLYVILKS